MSPLDLLYANDGSFRRRKRSSYDKSESPGISFVALLCIFSIISMCFLRYGCNINQHASVRRFK